MTTGADARMRVVHLAFPSGTGEDPRALADAACDRLRRLAAISAALTRATTPEDVEREVPEALALVPAVVARLVVAAPWGRLYVARGWPDAAERLHDPGDAGSAASEALARGVPAWRETREEITRGALGTATLTAVGVQAWGAFPIQMGDSPAVLEIGFGEPPRRDPTERAYVAVAARLIGFAVLCAWLARDRARIGEASRRNLALLDATLDAMPAGAMVLAGPEARVELANGALRKLLPHPERDPVDRPVEEGFPPEEGFRIREWVERMRATGEPVDAALRRPDGTVRHLRWELRPLPGGRDLLVVCDATAFAEARDAALQAAACAQRERAEIDAAIEAFAGGVVILSPAGEILRMNRTAMDVFGITPEDAPSAEPALLERLAVEWPGGRRVEFRETPFARAASGEHVRDQLLSFCIPGEARRWVNAAAAPLREDGRICAVVVSFVDVMRPETAHRDRETLLRRLSEDLARPLDAIIDRARRICSPASAAESPSASASEILRCAHRMASGLAEIRDAARLEDRSSPSQELVDVKAFLLDLVARSDARAAMSRVALSAAPALPRAYVDPDHLERIVVELVESAVAGAPAASRTAISAVRRGDRVRISVEAPGEIIPHDDLPHVFGRFYRARGRPIGRLHAARALVEANGGAICVESEAGRGLAIHVDLSIAR